MPPEVQRLSVYNVDLRPGHPKATYVVALIHILKGNLGVGLFAMGDAYKNGGLYVAPVLTFIVALICIHCQHQLLNCADVVTREYNTEEADYAVIVALCFENGPGKVATWAEKMGVCINTFICITQFGFCCVYLVFISSNLQQVLEANGINFDLRLLILVVWFPVWLTCLITNLNALAPVSMAANVLLFGSFSATICIAFMHGLPEIDKRQAYTTPWKLALFFGIIIFAYEGIALVLPVRNAMKNPKLFGGTFGVLNIGMTIVVLMYMLAGISGYLKWGENVAGSLTLNLGDTIFAQIVKVAVSIGIMFSYPLQFFVPIQVLLPTFLQKTNLVDRELIGEFILRTLMTISTVIIAEIIPNVGMFISLIGALCSTSLSLIFPPVLECILLQHTEHSRCVKSLILTKNIFILILGFIGFTVGTVISLIEIVKYFREIADQAYLKDIQQDINTALINIPNNFTF